MWVAAADTPRDLAAVRRDLVGHAYELLDRVHRFNQGKEWARQLGVQCYVHSEHERALLVQCLLEALADAELARAMFFLWERMKIVVEPTGSLAFTALFTGKLKVEGKRVGVVLSGGNVDLR